MAHASACGCSVCACSRALTRPSTATSWQTSLAARLGCVADSVRGLNTKLGLRPYTVRLVHTRWSGRRRGTGVELVARETDIVPTPAIQDMAMLRDLLVAPGRDEQGEVRITEISMRFTEDQLMGRNPDGSVAADLDFFWEVLFPQADGSAIRRRFTPSGPPILQPDKQQWVIDLLRASEDRMRDGVPGSGQP